MMNPPDGQNQPNERILNGNRNRTLELIGMALIETLGYTYTARPKPDIHALFRQFNTRYFQGQLSAVKLDWSRKLMPNAAGCFFGKHRCTIKLSSPMMKLRSRQEMVDVLLHQMIHAYIFVKSRSKNLHHGPQFCKFVHRINKHSGCNMTGIYNTKCEFDVYNLHWWQCDGPCKRWPKRFGLIKRQHNVAPGPLDSWWQHHQTKCGGIFQKIQEPTEETAQNCTEVSLTNAKGINGDPSTENTLSDSPNDEKLNEQMDTDSSDSLPDNNETVANEEQDQQNTTVPSKADNKQQKMAELDKKKKKRKHAILLKKRRNKCKHATNEQKPSTVVSTDKETNEQTTVINKEQDEQTTVVKKEQDEESTVVKKEQGEQQQVVVVKKEKDEEIQPVVTNSTSMDCTPVSTGTHTKGNENTETTGNAN